MSNKVIVNIKGREWKVEVLTHARFFKRYGEGSAITVSSESAIYVNRNRLTLGTIRHELLHALITESHVESSNLDASQIEELCCSLVDFQWNNIATWAEHCLNEFLRTKEPKEDV